MVVISDTTCLSALARIGKLDILHLLFQEVIIPEKVLDELLALSAFGFDTAIFKSQEWLKVQSPLSTPLLKELMNNSSIDPGEAHAIALAIELKADWLILDDMNARLLATKLHINITGLGGVLVQAKAIGIIPSLKPILDRCIEQANFRLATNVYQKILELAGEEP
jgi:predicted nucleic acid-binding protein